MGSEMCIRDSPRPVLGRESRRQGRRRGPSGELPRGRQEVSGRPHLALVGARRHAGAFRVRHRAQRLARQCRNTVEGGHRRAPLADSGMDAAPSVPVEEEEDEEDEEDAGEGGHGGEEVIFLYDDQSELCRYSSPQAGPDANRLTRSNPPALILSIVCCGVACVTRAKETSGPNISVMR